MKSSFHRRASVALLVSLVGLSLAAQTPPSTPEASPAHASALGFSYALPVDWQVTEFPTPPSLSGVKEQVQQNAASEDEKKGVGCAQVALTGRHGNPTSLVIVMQLPFACLGKAATDADLPGFAEGASAQLQQQFEFANTTRGSYSLGSHGMWIERSKGALKGHPELPYVTEIACSLLKKGAVCWMALAADDASLQEFEESTVVLEGEAPAALVPHTAFDKKP
jgi:hypothetical protein